MSKYKVGDKFIVEIDNVMSGRRGGVYGVKGLKTLVFDDCGLGKLERYNDAVRTKTYEDGLADAWEAARKMAAMSIREFECVISSEYTYGTVFDALSPQEAIAIVKGVQNE